MEEEEEAGLGGAWGGWPRVWVAILYWLGSFRDLDPPEMYRCVWVCVWQWRVWGRGEGGVVPHPLPMLVMLCGVFCVAWFGGRVCAGGAGGDCPSLSLASVYRRGLCLCLGRGRRCSHLFLLQLDTWTCTNFAKSPMIQIRMSLLRKSPSLIRSRFLWRRFLALLSRACNRYPPRPPGIAF